MKIVRFRHNDKIMMGTLNIDESTVTAMDNSVDKGVYSLEECILLNPVVPQNVIAIGLNYVEHVGEINKEAQIPEEPISFMVASSAVSYHNDEILLYNPAHRIDYEGELVVIIGKECEKVSEEEAEAYILGYCCGLDISDRDIQKKDGQWMRAKSFPGYKPIGPWIETELNPNNLNIVTRVNGEVRQNSNTSKMIFSVKKLISFLSDFMILCPGDIIFTGTPRNVGPLNSGDVVEVEIEGIGVLKNKVK